MQKPIPMFSQGTGSMYLTESRFNETIGEFIAGAGGIVFNRLDKVKLLK
jgi:hypothetical protein